MKKRILYTCLISVLSLNLFLGARLYLKSEEAAQRDEVYESMETFSRVLETVRDKYVDPEKVTYKQLIDGAMKGMLGTLDPHSEYMDLAKFRAMQEDSSGQFGGVGIQVSQRNGVLTVIAPMDGTPGAKAGLLAQDQIVRISGKSTEKMSLNDAVKLMRGRPDTSVKVTIRRPSTGKVFDLNIKRAIIRVTTVRDYDGKSKFPLMAGKTGYVRLSSFGDKTSGELEAALKKMEVAGMKSLILDLRDNPGGLLDQAVLVSEKFLAKGRLVVTTRGRDKRALEQRTASGRNRHPDYPVVILVNAGSASASEIVAGCLKDHGRAVLVGVKTFGKGTVQSILPLRNGAALRLTTAKYYTPSEKVINEVGILPDLKVDMTPQQIRDLFHKRSPGGLENLSQEERERAKKASDLQLDDALRVVRWLETMKPDARTKALKAKEFQKKLKEALKDA